MKRIFRYFTIACAAAMALASCDNAEYSVIENGVYISEAAPTDRFTQQIENQVVNGQVSKTLTIRLAKAVDTDVTVTLGTDQEFIDKYNKNNGTVYQMLPEDYRAFDTQVTIPAGSISAKANLTILPFETPNGESYALAVKIAGVNGPVEAVTDATHILYLLMAPHKQKAPRLNASSAAGSSVTFKNAFSPATWTVEYWLQMGNDYGYDKNYGRQYAFGDNSAPISFGELFLRWWATGALLKGPCYQNQMNNGFYFDDNTEAWVSNTWYHIAYTYDGTTIQLYIDGEKNANAQTPDGKVFTFDKITLVQSFTYGQNTAIAQVRMWDSCLTQATIKDAMNRGVPNDSPGLFGYWKCDEGEGNVLHDSSPNGNHITLRGTPNWDAFGVINFMEPNKK